MPLLSSLRLPCTFCLALTASFVACTAAPLPPPSLAPVRLQMTLSTPAAQPLDVVVAKLGASPSPGAVLQVRDGAGRVYAQLPIASGDASFAVAGALGIHQLTVLDDEGRLLAEAILPVDCTTGLQGEQHANNEGQPYTQLLAALYNTMSRTGTTMMNGKAHHVFVPWIRDHNHVLKSMKYFYDDVLTGVDLYRDTQKPNGMIWDNHSRAPKLNHWDERFAEFGFVGRFDNNNMQFRRIPVEADVEYLYVEAMWHAWKATGDDGWLAKTLPSGERALQYSLSDPMRWSSSLRLVKRGYTIDTWDFQNEEDAKRTGDPMKIDPNKTRFGVMFGDNTGVYHSALLLAEMLDHVGQKDRAAKWRADAAALRQRLDALSWNGKFYTHHVPEEASVHRDLGVDEKTQVSLSNAYSLNRGIELEKRQAIIKTYQDIRDHLPQGSPGEWYTIYPTFKKGYGGHNDEWQYMNGGVVSIVAGELAHGAFEAGFEDYGADILTRVLALTKKYGGRLPVTLKGANPPQGKPQFVPVSLAAKANIALTVDAANAHGGKAKPFAWIGEEGNDLPGFPRGQQDFKGVPFDVLADDANRARVAIGLSKAAGQPPKGLVVPKPYAEEATLKVAGKAATVFLLHAVSNAADVAGLVELQYKDGGSSIASVKVGSDVFGWWYPEPAAPAREGEGRGGATRALVAWEGKNARALRVGVSLLGVRNPHPERELSGIKFTAAPNGSRWMILGVTLSDQVAAFGDTSVSFGIPDNWGAAAVAYALLEGLAGVKDTSTKMQTVALAPRWAATPVTAMTSTVKYPASQGYVKYQFKSDGQTIRLAITGSGRQADVALYLPPGKTAAKVVRRSSDGKPQDLAFTTSTIGKSSYAKFGVPLNASEGVEQIEVYLAQP